jgi:hypothetical protein
MLELKGKKKSTHFNRNRILREKNKNKNLLLLQRIIKLKRKKNSP